MANQVNRVNSNENERENIKKVGEHVILNSNEKIDWTKEKAEKHLSVNWTNPNSFVSFLGIQRIENFYNKVLNKLEIKNVLSTIDSYSLMKQTPAHQKKREINFFQLPLMMCTCAILCFLVKLKISIMELKPFFVLLIVFHGLYGWNQ